MRRRRCRFRAAVEQHLHNATLLHADALVDIPDESFGLVHARFLLSHLADPTAAVANMRKSLRPGGTLVLEDVDFTGYFCHPPHDAFDRYLELTPAPPTAMAATRISAAGSRSWPARAGSRKFT